MDQLAATVEAGQDEGSMAKKGVMIERLLQIVSVTALVSISRKASHFELQLRGQGEERKGRR